MAVSIRTKANGKGYLALMFALCEHFRYRAQIPSDFFMFTINGDIFIQVPTRVALDIGTYLTHLRY